MSGKRYGWFIALYGSIFSALFVFIFMIMMTYRYTGVQHLPDWNYFVAGYDRAVSGDYQNVVDFFKDGYFYITRSFTTILTFGHWGNDGWLTATISGALFIWSSGMIIVLVGVAALLCAIMWLITLMLPLLYTAGYVLGTYYQEGQLMGAMSPASYYSGVGYPPMEDWSFVTVPVAMIFA